MSERSLPWSVRRAANIDSGPPRHGIFDAEDSLVAECYGEEDAGLTEALAIVTLMNYAGDRDCSVCGDPATCFGAYEAGLEPSYSCDECCGHGNEDGHCEPLEEKQLITGPEPANAPVADRIGRLVKGLAIVQNRVTRISFYNSSGELAIFSLAAPLTAGEQAELKRLGFEYWWGANPDGTGHGSVAFSEDG